MSHLKADFDKVTRQFIERKKWVSLEDINLKLPRSPGVYVVRSGNCISHIGQGNDINRRVPQLVELTTHRGSKRVLCVAFCTQKPPKIHYQVVKSKKERTGKGRKLKNTLGKTPTPNSRFGSCKDGRELRLHLLKNATSGKRGT